MLLGWARKYHPRVLIKYKRHQIHRSDMGMSRMRKKNNLQFCLPKHK